MDLSGNSVQAMKVAWLPKIPFPHSSFMASNLQEPLLIRLDGNVYFLATKLQ